MTTTWWEDAACLGEDIDLFFPAGRGSEFAPQIEEAKAICAGCPVRETCLLNAIHKPERYGIWGGLDEHERHLLRRNDRRRRHPQYSAHPAHETSLEGIPS